MWLKTYIEYEYDKTNYITSALYWSDNLLGNQQKFVYIKYIFCIKPKLLSFTC